MTVIKYIFENYYLRHLWDYRTHSTSVTVFLNFLQKFLKEMTRNLKT